MFSLKSYLVSNDLFLDASIVNSCQQCTRLVHIRRSFIQGWKMYTCMKGLRGQSVLKFPHSTAQTPILLISFLDFASNQHFQHLFLFKLIFVAVKDMTVHSCTSIMEGLLKSNQLDLAELSDLSKNPSSRGVGRKWRLISKFN